MALIGFPLGLIITSILSFGIWWQKKVAVEERSLAHASALRREMSLPALDRYTSILREVMQPVGVERLSAVASFLDSSMSPENMGYEPRRDRFYHAGLEVSNVEVELTGKQRPREIRLVLVPYGDEARRESEVQALAGLMALAHSVAGAREETTLRLAAVPLGVRDASGRTAMERLASACQEQQERVMKIIVLGGVGQEVLELIGQAFQIERRGTVLVSLPAPSSIEKTLAEMAALKSQL
jgi:hypothetical protein